MRFDSPSNERHGNGKDSHGFSAHEILICRVLPVLGEEGEVDADESRNEQHQTEDEAVQPVEVSFDVHNCIL
jgi:hypothetical protein